MELANIAFQELQRLLTAWQTPLLFVVVQVLVVLIYLKETSASAGALVHEEDEQEIKVEEFWSSVFDSVPTPLTTLPSFITRSTTSSLAASAALVVGLRKWARRASSSSSSRAASLQQAAAVKPQLEAATYTA